MNDWHWSFDVNVFGVVHGINAFVPFMIEQGTEGHVVNTSSGRRAGRLAGRRDLSLDESCRGHDHRVSLGATQGRQHEASARRCCSHRHVPASLLNTGIWQPGTNRPERYARENDAQPEGFDSLAGFLENMKKAGTEVKFAPLEEIGDIVLESVREDKFWISANDGQGMADKLQQRIESQTGGGPPNYLLGSNIANQSSSNGAPKRP